MNFILIFITNLLIKFKDCSTIRVIAPVYVDKE
jgi:hypothetical protein